MPLQFRRGTDAQRTAVTPAAGEPIWVTDTQALYVGDGSTAGGVAITGGGGGGGAPTAASYLVLATHTSLSAERVLTIGTGLASTDAGANGNYTIAIGTHAASYVNSGTLALARGGLAADISGSGPGFLRQTALGAAVSVSGIVATDLPTHNHVASNITSGTLALSVGGLAADLSATGGSGQVLKQTAAGAAISVGAILAADLPTHTHSAGDIASGTLALARGGLAADISATGGAGFVLKQTSAGAAVTVAALVTTDLPTHNHVASNITSGTLALSIGGLAADLSATGGTARFLKQTAVGAAVSVATIAATEVGTSGTPSTSTFLRGDMTWGTPAGGAGGGTKTYAAFTPLNNQPPTSAFATLDTRGAGVAVLDFDQTALEHAVFVGCLPEAAVTTNGLKVRLVWTADTVTNTDAVVWAIAWQRIDTSTDLDTDAFSNTVTATAAASGTAGVPVITEITITGTANLDSIVAGDFYRVRISRDGTNASDALTNDACLIGVEIRDAT